MGLSSTGNGNDDDIDELEHLHDDDPAHRRASLLSTTTTGMSSGRSSPIFSRRGSLQHQTHVRHVNDEHGVPSMTASPIRHRGLPLRSHSDAGLMVPHHRDRHPPPTSTYNYDGIIKYPSRYPHARWHHHDPAHLYGRSTSHANNNAAPVPPAGSLPPPTSGHPHYYTQKRHSFAALRRASSPSNHKMAAESATILPQVRLPSIDHGLPPFSATDAAAMILPLRRGSLTDPLLHAHNSSATGPSSISNSLLAGPSGTISSSSLSPYNPSSSNALSPGPSLAEDRNYGGTTASIPFNPYPSPGIPSPVGDVSTLASTSAAAQESSLPFFKKTSKTLFPQQHGSGSQSVTSPISPSGNAAPHPSISPSGTPSVLGTKRKLEPLSESDTLLHGERSKLSSGAAGRGGDYFTTPTGITSDDIDIVSQSGGLPVDNLPLLNTAKRRASQPFDNAANGQSSNGAVELLPTPISLVSSNSANGGRGDTQSASSSERRSSGDSNSNVHANNNDSSSNVVLASNDNSMSMRDGLQGDGREGIYSNITPRDHHRFDDLDSMDQSLEVDHKPGYAFPPSSSSQAQHRPPPLHLEGSRQVPSPDYVAHQTYFPSQPYANEEHQNGNSMPSYGSASVQTRVPPPGASLPLELRSKASTIFGGPAVSSSSNGVSSSGGRPSYSSNGTPVSYNNVHGSHPSMYGGHSLKEGSLHNKALYQIQQQDQHVLDQKEGASSSGGATSNLPYARSPALKVSHKIAERKRRKEMKELFDELRDCIPSMSTITPHPTVPLGIDSNGNPILPPPQQPPPPDVGGRGIKSSKWEILAKAVEYINKLQFENLELNNSIAELQRLNTAFQDELASVRHNSNNSSSSLGNNGVSGIGGPGGGNGSNRHGAVEVDGFGDQIRPSAPDGVVNSMRFQQQQQQHQHQQRDGVPLYPHQQQGTISKYHGSSAAPSPSPVSVHSMPPLTHHSHSMPAAIGGVGSGMQTPLVTGASSVQHSPVQNHQGYPISAPPHMASQSFFGPNDGHPGSHHHHQQQQSHSHLDFAQPIPATTRQFSHHRVHHSRNVSLNSNSGGTSDGVNAQFEHAGSAPPALQHHPHLQLQPSPLGGGAGAGELNHTGSPMPQHQNAQQIFAHQPAPYPTEMHTQAQPNAQYNTQQQQIRPGSLRSQHSSHGPMSAGQSHLSQSPQPVQPSMHHLHQQQPSQGQENWIGSPYQHPHQQQMRSGTVPPASAQGKPMMSPLNTSY